MLIRWRVSASPMTVFGCLISYSNMFNYIVFLQFDWIVLLSSRCDEHWALEELDLHVPEELMHQADMFNILFGHTCQVLTIPNAPVSCFDVCQGSSRSKVFIVFTALLSVFQGQTPESPQSEESPVPANRQAQNQAESTKSLISTCRTIDEICENALPPRFPYQIIFLPTFCLLSWRTLR